MAPLWIARHGPRQTAVEDHVERQVFGLRHVPEGPLDVFVQRRETDVFDIHGDGAGFDLGEVEDVVDEVEKVGTGRIDVS